jgi:hypothetical protein
MTQLCNWFGVQDNGLQALISTRDPTPTDYAQGGVFLSPLYELLVTSAATTGNDNFVRGWRLSPAGAVYVTTINGAAAAGANWDAGLMFTSDGRLCITTDAADHYVAGVPVNVFGAVCAAGGAPPNVIFQAPLLTTLVPTFASGSPTPTFTRASLAYTADFEGILRRSFISAARFRGARMVANLLAFTEDFSNAAWANDFGTAVVTVNDALAPDGTLTADKVVFGGVNGGTLTQTITDTNRNLGAGAVYRGSCWVKGTSGEKFNIWTRDNAGLGESALQITLDGTWQRLTPGGTSTATNNTITLVLGTRNLNLPLGTAATVWLWGAQLEVVGGASNQAPGDYVSNNVLAAPFFGAGINGVRYFNTVNGNSAAAGVVTNATGAAISDATLQGYVSESQRTNSVLQSQTFDNATWTKLNATVTANSTAAPDGTVTADTITDDATNAAHQVSQAAIANFTNTFIYAASVYVKQGTVAWCQLQVTAAVTKWVNVNLATGAVGFQSAGITQVLVQTLPNGWFRITMMAAADATAAGSMFISTIAADTNAASPAYVGTGQTMFVWGAQLEAAAVSIPYASSYLNTSLAGAALTRAFDKLTFVPAGNVVTALGSSIATMTPDFPVADTATHGILTLENSVSYPISLVGMVPTIYDGTTSAQTAGSVVQNVKSKVASRWGAAGPLKGIILNAGAIVNNAFDGDMGGTVLQIGNWTSGSVGANAAIRDVSIYNIAISDGQMAALTT